MGSAFSQLMDWNLVPYFVLGLLNGMFFGIMPGLSGSVGIALMIPFTLSMTMTQVMVVLTGALSGQTFAGSITAILINTPGTAPNAATTFDGYQLTRQGKGGLAIGVSAMASAMGTLVGIVVLILMLPLARATIMAFSFPEIALLSVLGIAAIAACSQESLLKGLIAGGFGIMLSFVGFDIVSGELRYTFGLIPLWDGINFTSALIGLFAISEVVKLMVRRERIALDTQSVKFAGSQVWEGVGLVFRHPVLFIRSAIIGTVAGIIPGVGGTVASFLAYFQAVHGSKDPEKFGKGDPRGVLAPEAANDAKDAAAALPTLAFGIPGSSDWAIVLGAMMLKGVTPGPMLLRNSPDLIWIVIWTILAASWASSIVGVIIAPKLVKVTLIRPAILAPVVAILAVVGSYGLDRNYVHVVTAIAFGILGYFMKIYKVPVVPLILGLLLGYPVERAYYQTAVLFGGPIAFFTRPISLVLVFLILLVLSVPLMMGRRHRKGEKAYVQG